MKAWTGKIILLAIMLVAIVAGCFQLEQRGYLDYFRQIEECDNYNELITYVEREIAQGKDQTKVYVKGITEEEIRCLNQSLDGFYGNVNTFYCLPERMDHTFKVVMDLEISLNYYAYQCFLKDSTADIKNKKAIQLYEVSKDILSSIITKDMDEFDKETAIHDYIVSHSKYDYLSGEEYEDSFHAYGILVEGKGVCNGYAEAMQLLLSMSQVNSMIITGQADEEEHAWNLVQIDSLWYHVDATWDDPVPDKEGRVLHEFFNLSDEQIKGRHVWEYTRFPSCISTNANYYQRNNQICHSYNEFVTRVNQLISTKRQPEISFVVTDYNEEEYNFEFIYENACVKQAYYTVSEDDNNTSIVLELEYE